MNLICIFSVIILIVLSLCVKFSEGICEKKDYCPDGWSILRRADGTPETCDPLGGKTKCQKPYSCVHSSCGMNFCCSHPYKIEQYNRQKEIEEEMKEAEEEADDEL